VASLCRSAPISRLQSLPNIMLECRCSLPHDGCTSRRGMRRQRWPRAEGPGDRRARARHHVRAVRIRGAAQRPCERDARAPDRRRGGRARAQAVADSGISLAHRARVRVRPVFRQLHDARRCKLRNNHVCAYHAAAGARRVDADTEPHTTLLHSVQV